MDRDARASEPPAVRQALRVDRALADGVRRTGTTVLGTLAAAAVAVLRPAVHRLPGGAARLVADLPDRAQQARAALEHAAAGAVGDALRWAAEAAFTALDVTDLVRRHVDLDALAAVLDVDAVVARADLDAVVDRLDLDDLIARVDLDGVLSRIDVDTVVARIDLDSLLSGVDLDGVAARVDLDAVLSRVDLNGVAARVDLDGITARVDLDAIVRRIDPDALVSRVDLDSVIARLDLVTLTRSVLEAIDLPQILRESSGAVSSQAARVVRTEGMHADDSVSRWVDRVLRRGNPGVVTP